VCGRCTVGQVIERGKQRLGGKRLIATAVSPLQRFSPTSSSPPSHPLCPSVPFRITRPTRQRHELRGLSIDYRPRVSPATAWGLFYPRCEGRLGRAKLSRDPLALLRCWARCQVPTHLLSYHHPNYLTILSPNSQIYLPSTTPSRPLSRPAIPSRTLPSTAAPNLDPLSCCIPSL
jgi:hypothetical protein